MFWGGLGCFHRPTSVTIVGSVRHGPARAFTDNHPVALETGVDNNKLSKQFCDLFSVILSSNSVVETIS